MYIAILGRQPALGMAELEHLFGSANTKWFSDESAIISTDDFPLQAIGGTQKAGNITDEFNAANWQDVSRRLVQSYSNKWSIFEGKLTLGISAYGFPVSAKEVQKTGVILKQKLKKANVNLRLIPNQTTALSSATAHHNKLGLSHNKIELLIVRSRSGRIIVAESIGAQNITALARRDQGRPKRDAFVGMLPPKLAQIIINLARTHKNTASTRLLDPFCGTGVILQEAALMGFSVYGTDLSEKMIDYSEQNLAWLESITKRLIHKTLHPGDAMSTRWQAPIESVACEAYLGQPFSAPPSPAKLEQVQKNCQHIIGQFLENISRQVEPGTPLCVAVPAWRRLDGSFSHLPLVNQLEQFGFREYAFEHIKHSELIYHREDQVVGRELLVIVKT